MAEPQRIWAIVSLRDGSVVMADPVASTVRRAWRDIPDAFRRNYDVYRYDAYAISDGMARVQARNGFAISSNKITA